MNHQRLTQAWKRRVCLPLRRRYRPEVTVSVRGRPMRVDVRDCIIGYLLYLSGEYEGHLLDLVGYLPLGGASCLDIGANIGLYALALGQMVGPSGQVFAFEPEQHNYDLLTANVRMNGAANIFPVNAAVGDREGRLRLAINPDNFGDHHVASDADSRTKDVPVLTIDQFWHGQGEPQVAFIKIDTQGYEWHVLRGMADMLRGNPDAVILIEVWPEGLKRQNESAVKLIQFFRDHGFTGYEISDHRVMPVAEPWTYNCLFGSRSVDCVFSRNANCLHAALSLFMGRAFPPAES